MWNFQLLGNDKVGQNLGIISVVTSSGGDAEFSENDVADLVDL